MKYKLFLFALGMLFTVNSFANTQYTKENLNRIIPVSPNAASLGIFGSIPVGHHTGVPQISVPIHQIDFHGLSLPIELNYHASGIKVTQEASSVGLGWALNAGGCISRNIQHLDDFTTYQGYYESTRIKPPYPEGENPQINSQDYLPFMGLQGTSDAEPDFFTYTFGAHSGAFFLKPYVQSGGIASIMGKENDVKIQYIKSTTSWEVTDAYGFKYIFGSTEETRETARTYSRPGMYTTDINGINRSTFNAKDLLPAVTSWYLESIVSPQNDVIRFKYKKEKLLTKYQFSEEKYFRVDYSFPDLMHLANEYDSSSISYSENEQLILSSIEYNGGSVVFEYETRTDLQLSNVSNISKKLTSVTVYENETAVSPGGRKRVKHCTLTHSYMGNAVDYQNSRLMLNELCFVPTDPSSTDIKKYRFSYNPGVLPSKYSQAVDYWGYHNGLGSPNRGTRENTAISPFIYLGNSWHWQNLSFGGMYRKPEERCAKYGTLQSIQYPTGGKTVFDFELNDFTDKITVGTLVGNEDLTRGAGLRVKQITDLAGDRDTVSVRRFMYKKNNVSSGRLKIVPTHYKYVKAYDYFEGNLPPVLTQAVTYINIHSEGFSSSILNAGNVGYSYVEEHQVAHGKNNGHTAHLYINHVGAVRTSVFGVPTLISLGDGKPLQITHYNSNGAPVKKQTFNYTIFSQGSISGFKCYVPPMYDSFFIINNKVKEDFQVAYYTMYANCMLESSVIEEEYFPNGTQVKITAYGYDSVFNLKNYQKTTVNGQVYETRIKYPTDFTDNISTHMQSKHMIGLPVETIHTYNGKVTDAQKTAYSIYTAYDNSAILPTSVYHFRNNAALSIPASEYANHYKKEVQIDAYNAYGNVLQYTDRDNLKVVYLWSRGKYPLAMIKNATAQEVDRALVDRFFIDMDDLYALRPDQRRLDGLQAQLPQAQVTLFTHNPGKGVASISAPSGKTVQYDFDGMGRLHQVKNSNNQLIERYHYNYSNK